MEKSLLDRELEIIKVNNGKKKLLNQMLELDYVGLIDSEDYLTKIDLYKRLSSRAKKLIDDLDEKQKLLIISNIRRLNKEVLIGATLKDAISKKSDGYIVLQRTMIDLGLELTQLYRENRAEKLKRELVNVCSMYGVELEDEIKTADEWLINHYMVCDYTNVLYSQISELLKSEKLTDIGRLNLLKMKYNLIFIASNMETRAIQNAFLISDNPRLIDRNDIYESGIEYRDYLNKLDSIMVSFLENDIYSSLHIKNMNRQPICLADLIFIKTYASILSDDELLDCIELDKTLANSSNYLKSIELIEDSFSKAKARILNNNDLRKFSRI